MNVTGLLQELRDQLHDSGANEKWSDAELIRHAQRQLRSIARTQVEKGEGYHNFTLLFQEGDGTEVMKDTWEYRLPSWVAEVTSVMLIDPPAVAQSTYSPYLWTELVTMGQPIRKWSKGSSQSGWAFAGNNALRMYRYSDAESFAVMVAKIPPALFTATIATVNLSNSKIYLPASLTKGAAELDEGAYINANIMVTALQTATDPYLGQQLRCIYSTPNASDGGTRRHELSLDQSFTGPASLRIGDKVETVLPFPDEHTRYLILRVAMAAWQKLGDVESIRSIRIELAEEKTKYEAYVAPRDSHSPGWVRTSTGRRRTYGMDLDPVSERFA